jgi:magnesium transporter
VIAVEELISAPTETPANVIMDKAPIAISPLADQEECAQYMTKYDLSVLPVVDAKRRLIGIITVDDILEVMEAEASEDMYRLAGVGATDPLEEAAAARAWKRLPWLAVSIVGYAALCFIMARFEVALERIVALTFFVPAIMALGGNVGIQAATITVRGLAMGEIRPSDYFWILKRELLVALIIGLVCSAALAGVAWGVFALGLQTATTFAVGEFVLTVSVAMFVGILGAVVFGTAVPMLCAAVGIDPAVAAGPFITALVDIGTQTIYLGLATALLLS